LTSHDMGVGILGGRREEARGETRGGKRVGFLFPLGIRWKGGKNYD
jgi:hypothetical protein